MASGNSRLSAVFKYLSLFILSSSTIPAVYKLIFSPTIQFSTCCELSTEILHIIEVHTLPQYQIMVLNSVTVSLSVIYMVSQIFPRTTKFATFLTNGGFPVTMLQNHF
jgi:hypothetical protein